MSEVLVSQYKKSIYDLGLPREWETALWDFYVTKSVADSASQKRTAADYGLKQYPIKEMLQVAGIEDLCIKVLPASSINKTLQKAGLDSGKIGTDEEIAIDIDKPRIVCLTPFYVSDDDPPKVRMGNAESILTHIRNAFAHGNTYFFENGNTLLEDKNRNIITARILLKLQTLLDWIGLIDKEQRFYILRDLSELGNEEADLIAE